ncbi:hypothetical protein Ciccas_008205 [Cichlidogyrus casuarinus]|uniref:Tudor domain-containing protein n=1 Tax=Cichlidogyrus casuarinus TaxID=1844966 RepID=A0ABD2Q0Y3_9PLAT
MAGTFVSAQHNDSPNSANASPKAITPEPSSTSSYIPESIPSGCFNDPENDIVEDSPEIFGGKAIPRVLIPSDIWQQITDDSIWSETFSIPARMGGVLIGRYGKNVRELRSQWKAEFSLNMSPDNQDLLIFRVACPVEYKVEVLNWVSQRFKMRPSRTTIGNPNQLRRYLPFGVATPVHVRSSYGLKEMFVTVPDDKFARFVEMQREMDLDYSNYSNQRMRLCEPVTSGTVSVLPHSQGFARALILKVFHVQPVKYALYFLLDHGVFGLVQINELRKIRAKYMRLPFQAIHVSWAHALPLFNDMPEMHLLRTFFSSGQIHATSVRMETCCRASVVFTDLMVVSKQTPQNMVPTGPFPTNLSQDPQEFPPLGDAQLKMVDVLAICCRTGLYTVAPLVIYPSRQCWLNQSETPYFTYDGGDIDYQSYVSYIMEDGITNSSVSPDSGAQLSSKASKKNRKSRRKKHKQSTESSSADDKENKDVPAPDLPPSVDSNNNNATVLVRPPNNPWGKPIPYVPEPVAVVPTPEQKPEPTKVEEVVEPPKPVKLTMAQIVAMAPTPPRVVKKPVAPVPVKKETPVQKKERPEKKPRRKPTSNGESAPKRRPLKSRNQQTGKGPQDGTSH